MNFAQMKFHSCLLGIVLLILLPVNVTSQTSRDESQPATTTGAISGFVMTENGQPLPNATVTLRGSTPFSQPRLAMTDNEGHFEVTGLSAELYGVSAFAPGYVSPPREPDSPPVYYRLGDSISLRMIKGAVITGSVLSATGEPVVQVTVRALLIRDANGEKPQFPFNQTPRATDDRGIFRIYGLLPGTYLVSAGGRGSFGFSSVAFDSDTPTYAPSSTRDTATEITVRAGEEIGGVNIRYRGEPGHAVSGQVVGLAVGPGPAQPSITLMEIANGVPLTNSFSFQPLGKGFSFNGVSDGDYVLTAQLSLAPGEILVSDPRRVTVKGADVTGVELALKPLASVSGKVSLEPSTAPECANKRRPLFAETLVAARRSERGEMKDQPRPISFSVAQGSPNKSGEFMLRNLSPGQYSLSTRFFAKYWFLRSVARPSATTRPGSEKPGLPNRQSDLARNGLTLAGGERANGVTITLAEGAGSLRGSIKVASGETVPPRMVLYLVPAEKENAEDVLRFFSAEVNSDATFAFNNLPPGRYFALTRILEPNDPRTEAKLRAPEAGDLRTQLRRAGEAGKASLEFKHCQNIVDYRMPFSIPSAKP